MTSTIDAMTAWLDNLAKLRSDDSRELTGELLQKTGYPPVPEKGTNFISMEAYFYAINVGATLAEKYVEDSLHDREVATTKGELLAVERALDRAHFWTHVNGWFERRMPPV